MTREVTLVCGPPCAGKSTYVAARAGLDDIVLDHDEIAKSMGSSLGWTHRSSIARRAEARVQHRLETVAAMQHGSAWVIRCAARARHREHLATLLRADAVLVLLPDVETLMQRAMQRPKPDATIAAIRRWIRAYRPAACDELIP